MLICAYHSNLYMDSFIDHVKEIKEKGFDTLLFAIGETDLLYNLEIFREFKEYSESERLKTWATFWGLTAGENVCKECNVYKWLEAVTGLGFKDIMIDEPKVGDSIDYIYYQYKHINFHLCASDDTFYKISDEEIKEMPVKSFGVSNYHWTTDWVKIVNRSGDIADRLYRLRPDNNFVFLQGFDLVDGMEDVPMIVKNVCEIHGIKNFGFWSFRGTITGAKRSANPKIIWDNVNFKTNL